MQPLEKTLRNKLEKTVKEARDIAEAAARVSLEQLGVGEASPFKHLNDEQKELRRKLRAHGRQLGDQRDPEAETQEIGLLIEEVAYEHWHRMLFARFLAENNLLMYPDPVDPVAVTLEECEDLAAEEDAKNGWELAARYASRMLPQIFRPDSPVFQLILPPEHQQKLERLLTDLPPEIFTASDSLGWVYQFWQAKKKDEVNASGVKIGARELPAVTQLFTEPYMVSFLLDNSLGAWWAAHRLTEEDLKNAESEEELRKKASLPGVPLEYLRFVKTEEGKWTPAAGTYDGWPERLSEFKILDPCCGSGHFLVAAFLMLVPMCMELEGLSTQSAVNSVLRKNLHGLEIDPRCVELAAFTLALTAWRYPGFGGYCKLPELNVACSGLSISSKREDWLKLARDDPNLQFGLNKLYEQFKQTPLLGSLINPEAGLSKGNLIEMKWEGLVTLLAKALSDEQDVEKMEMGVVAQGLAKAAMLLSEKYHYVITNVPYKNKADLVQAIQEYFEQNYSEAKAALETVFLVRCLELCLPRGTCCIVITQNWLFLTSYKKLRNKLLKHKKFNMIARLGEGGFDSQAASGAFAALVIISNEQSKCMLSNCQSGENKSIFSGIDVSSYKGINEKSHKIITEEIIPLDQLNQLNNPDSTIILDVSARSQLLSEYASCYQGSSTGDNPSFVRQFWEIERLFHPWELLEAVPAKTTHYAGKQQIINWNGIINFQGAAIRGWEAFGKCGIAIGQMRSLPATLYLGARFPNTTPVIIPHNAEFLSALWTFCSSSIFATELRKINQKLSVDNGYVGKITFDLDQWQKKATEKYPRGLPNPYSEDPTQWVFHGHPAKSDEPLQVAVTRLLGYRWPAELDGEMELSDEAWDWVKKCDELIFYADKDGIVCIPPVRGEAPATDQLLNLLATAYGDSWNNDKLSELLKQADHAGKSLESWLREKFFTQHCKLFQHRPFIWHIWDGLRDGFGALVNYHKLDKKLLETLIYTYLGDWISRQKRDIDNGIDGAEEKREAAENLKKKLELILEGEAPYDIFVRWKHIEKQPIGWDPDLNDGVRLNIRPFINVPDVGKKGAGVLRDKPNINWNKDRGTDVESAPWYNLGLEYGGKKGDRINDHHLTLEEKRRAREEAK